MGRPKGSLNKDKPYRDALKMELAARGDGDLIAGLRSVARVHIARAMAGDTQALTHLADRVDGKVPQAIGGDDELGPVRHLVTWDDADD